jgi:hypothetical protein
VPTDKYHGGVPTDRPYKFHDQTIGEMAALAATLGATMQNVPSSTGIGAPGTAPAPASLARSPMSNQPNAPATAIPFTRGATLATMRDATRSYAPGAADQVQLQTNAFLENVIIDVNLTTAGNAATVVFAADAPWNAIAQIKLDDPAGQSIVAPITGYHLYALNKYLPDVECFFDPKADPNFYATAGAGGTGGSFGFRLILPIEHRRRDALGALNNSAANQRYLITINMISTFGGTTGIYTTAPTTPAATISVQYYQQYWTAPPGTITTAQGAAQVQQTPSGLGTVGFVRYERHNEVSGGGSPQIQFNNVGDYISSVIFILRDTAGARDVNLPPQSATNANVPPEFDFWVNDFQTHALSMFGPTGTGAATGIGGAWPRGIGRFFGYGLPQAVETAKGMDNGVWPLFQLHQLFDQVHNFEPANQYLPTDATTKLQIRGSTWGSGASFLEVLTRMIRPVSGAALFS